MLGEFRYECVCNKNLRVCGVLDEVITKVIDKVISFR